MTTRRKREVPSVLIGEDRELFKLKESLQEVLEAEMTETVGAGLVRSSHRGAVLDRARRRRCARTSASRCPVTMRGTSGSRGDPVAGGLHRDPRAGAKSWAWSSRIESRARSPALKSTAWSSSPTMPDSSGRCGSSCPRPCGSGVTCTSMPSTICPARPTTIVVRSCAGSRHSRQAWLMRWATRYPKLTDWVEAHIGETLNFYSLPRQHHTHRTCLSASRRSSVARGWSGSFPTAYVSPLCRHRAGRDHATARRKNYGPPPSDHTLSHELKFGTQPISIQSPRASSGWSRAGCQQPDLGSDL